MSHMKRLVVPNTWPIERKKIVFVTCPLPNGAKTKYGVTLSFMLKELLGICKSNKEVKHLIVNKLIRVNNSIVKDEKQLVSLFQLITIGDKSYRISFRGSGKLNVVEADNDIIINKIMNKTIMKKGKVQINMFDGRNMIVDDAKEIKTGSSLAFKDKSFMVLPLEKGASVMLFDGKHRGKVGKIENIDDQYVMINADDEMIKTLKKYCFVISKTNEQAIIKV